ncbi:hypothetical protein WICMUC_001376 [Wickerhamomyces mucosus]|uniref:Uncharacterized protein n=1 Tax=Wickerhamomyces mucosus TaxID=1378264 RepID=A0A9P8PVW2_9ASCO|nr:hypothetical protein WICMUC_001376 [Wickerhamomyces mucosus]
MEYQIYDILKGDSIIPNGVTNEEYRLKINELTKDLPFTQLIKGLDQRYNIIILSSRINLLSSIELEELLRIILNKIEIPINFKWQWDSNNYDSTLYNFQLNLQTQCENLLVLLNQLLVFVDKRIDMKLYRDELIIKLSKFTLMTPWSSNNSIKIVNEFIIPNLLLSSSISINDQLIKLSQEIKFKFKELPKNSDKITSKGYKNFFNTQSLIGLNPSLGFNESNSREIWKSESVSWISSLNFLIKFIDKPQNQWGIIVPSLLNILDDYEIGIKLIGMEILQNLFYRFDDEDQYLIQTGIFPIFMESLIPNLSYLPNSLSISTDLSSKILKTTYNVIIQLIIKFNPRDKVELELLKILSINIFSTINLIKDNIKILEILIEEISKIVEIIKFKTIKSLPRLLYIIGILISDPYLNTQSIKSSKLYPKILDLIIQIELNCWMRLSNHMFDLLGMFIICYKKEDHHENFSNEIDEKIEVGIELLYKSVDQKQFKLLVMKLIENDPSLNLLFAKYI